MSPALAAGLGLLAGFGWCLLLVWVGGLLSPGTPLTHGFGALRGDSCEAEREDRRRA